MGVAWKLLSDDTGISGGGEEGEGVFVGGEEGGQKPPFFRAPISRVSVSIRAINALFSSSPLFSLASLFLFSPSN